MTTFYEEFGNLQTSTLSSLARFAPELALCIGIVALLLFRIICGRRLSASLMALATAGAALYFAAANAYTVCCGSDEAAARLLGDSGQVELFGRMLVFDPFTIYFRVFLLSFAFLFVLFTWRSGIPDREDGPDFYTLALGATLGMCLMASANHLLMVFLGVEMASVPSYALAGMLKGRRESSEAALKFSVYGAGAAGVMLYGISLLAGVVGSVHLPTMARGLADVFLNDPQPQTEMVLALGGLMVMVGLAFKLSAVPFHFWAPDVFEGTSAEIGGFLSVASKAAAVALLVRVAIGLGYVPERPAAVAGVPQAARLYNVDSAPPDAGDGGENHDGAASYTEDRSARMAALQPVRTFAAGLIAFLAAITATFGNLAAYGQTNIKRLLAYSTIAHAGYMMMPVAAAVALSGEDAGGAAEAIGSVAFYVAIYLFMNLGAFMIVAFLRNTMGSEQIADYGGLMRRSPGVAICLALILISLLGIPPLAGFMAKVTIFGAVADAQMWTLLTVGCVNTALSLFYYLRVVKVMVFESEPEDAAPLRFPLFGTLNGWFVFALTLPLIVLGIFWDGIHAWAIEAGRSLFS